MNIEQIQAAAERASGHIRRTPLLESPAINALAGRRVMVKAECLQHTGSFKARGGWASVSALSPEARKRGVCAMSSGNHAQGVARAAQFLGAPATIVMPKDAPQSKIDGTRSWGADIVFYDRATEDRIVIAQELTQAQGFSLIPPYDHPETIAGQGTCGLEIAEQAAELGIETADVVVCAGGGGLASGIALALEAKAPSMRVHLAEPEHYDDWGLSLKAGQPQSVDISTPSICDAILSPAPGTLTFPILQAHEAKAHVVTDKDALSAMALYFKHLKLVVEPGGAVALATALKHKDQFTQDTVIVTASGGNVDPDLFSKALELS
ncbi:MAG: threonine/serine dehydratase [Pseudomonadota bacterium]